MTMAMHGMQEKMQQLPFDVLLDDNCSIIPSHVQMLHWFERPRIGPNVVLAIEANPGKILIESFVSWDGLRKFVWQSMLQ